MSKRHPRGSNRGYSSASVCIRKGDRVERVKRVLAEQRVNEGWEYCSKSVWKESRKSVSNEDKPKTKKGRKASVSNSEKPKSKKKVAKSNK